MPSSRISPPQLLMPAAVWMGSLLLAGGCRAAVPPVPSAVVPPSALHWPVPPPPAVAAASPVLWVALAAHLRPPAPLELRSAAGNLTLQTASGQRFQAPQLQLHWRSEPLAEPLTLRRQVWGPFASHESAQEAAARWRQAGASPVIAHPGEWEVWAAADAPVPAGVTVRRLEQLQRQRLVLELRRPAGPLLLEGPLRLEAPGGLRWQGGVFAGPFRLQSDAYGSWTLVEEVPLERYLLGVVPHEIGAGAPPAALAAQAVLARTWAVRNQERFAVDGYHLCADTQCQVYGDPRQAGAAVRQAIGATRHQVLAWQGAPIHAVYHATNGGIAAGFEEVWSGDALPYLRPRVDASPAVQARVALPLDPAGVPAALAATARAYGFDHPRFRWSRSLDAAQIQQALSRAALPLAAPTRVAVLQRGPSGRVLALEIEAKGSAGAPQRQVLRRDAIRRTLRQLPSTLFVVRPDGLGRWRFEGGGFGHGAGLSQAGAIDLARRGWSLARILEHYYPGTSLQPLGALPGANPTGPNSPAASSP
ncbi:SpoIID/LytB domain-containing protein [Synechococcus sp. 8F6]|uniref:SpoIID/LytB domain-containing protein n=1 Tax=Synechococcus sp. 8F6 TaxID=2025606 RepID=UPI001E2E1915|nr:SpoIID/LytB domain-containing protein [Synechococcus sp. 8F6]